MSYEAEPTYETALKVWWALFWRIMPTAIAGAILIGFVIGLASGALNIDVNAASIFSGILGFVFGMWVILFMIRRLMVKGFGRYRLAVMVK